MLENKRTIQAVVAGQEAMVPDRFTQKIALFNKDGSPYRGPQSYIQNPALEGLPVWTYGNSYIGQDVMSTVGARWTDRVKQRLGLGVITNRHEGGSSLWDIGKRLIGNSGTVTLAAGTKGIVMIGGAPIGEQLAAADGNDPVQRAYAKNTTRALLAAASSALRAETSTFTATGAGWTVSNQAYFSAGSYRFTGTPGDYIEYVAGSGTEWSSTHDIFIPSPAIGLGRLGANISVNGTVVLANVGTVASPAPEPSITVAGHDVYTLTGIKSGDVIRITGVGVKVAGTFTTFGVDFASVRSTAPPLVVFINEPDLKLGTAVNVEGFRQAIKEGCDEFPNALCIDVAPGFVKSKMMGNDNLHLNDYGQAYYADVVTDALQDVSFRHGLNKLTLATV